MKLSDKQRDVLAVLLGGGADDVTLRIHAGGNWQSAILALERRDLVQFRPYGGLNRDGVWKLTDEGRKVAKGLVVEEEESK